MATTFAAPQLRIPESVMALPKISPQTRRKVVSFVAIGTVFTGAYLLLYLLLRQFTEATTANFLSQLITTIGSTAANRRITFGVTDRSTVGRHHAQMIGVFVFGLLVNSSALSLLSVVSPDASSFVELVVLSISSLVTTAARVMLMRRWAH